VLLLDLLALHTVRHILPPSSTNSHTRAPTGTTTPYRGRDGRPPSPSPAPFAGPSTAAGGPSSHLSVQVPPDDADFQETRSAASSSIHINIDITTPSPQRDTFEHSLTAPPTFDFGGLQPGPSIPLHSLLEVGGSVNAPAPVSSAAGQATGSADASQNKGHDPEQLPISTLISYHPPTPHGSPYPRTTAERMYTRMRAAGKCSFVCVHRISFLSFFAFVGKSVYWSSIYARTVRNGDPTFVLLSMLWYPLYAWVGLFSLTSVRSRIKGSRMLQDEAFDALVGEVSWLVCHSQSIYHCYLTFFRVSRKVEPSPPSPPPNLSKHIPTPTKPSST
jgi:hypothetical protein